MKVLIVKSSAFGDIVQAFPCVAWLKQKFPVVSIDWVVESMCESIVAAHPGIERTLVVESHTWRKNPFAKSTWSEIRTFYRLLRACEYDVVFDLQGNTKSLFCTGAARAKVKVGFGWKDVSEWPNLLATHKKYDLPSGKPISADYLHLLQSYFMDFSASELPPVTLKIQDDGSQATMQDLLQRFGGDNIPLVMVCPGSKWINKRLTLPALQRFLELLEDHLKCRYVFIWGSSQEKGEVELLHGNFSDSIVADRLSLPALQNLMGKMDLVISADSLGLHLAATTDTPTFSYFGPSAAAKFKPAGAKHFSIQASCPYNQRFEKRCRRLRSCVTGACLRSLSGEEVFQLFLAQTAEKLGRFGIN